jgi:hypothetical protein
MREDDKRVQPAGSTGAEPRDNEEVSFASDSPVEEDGFEPSVPRGSGSPLLGQKNVASVK